LRRLPVIALAGTLLPIAAAFAAYHVAGSAADFKFVTGLQIAVVSLLSLHWTVVLTAAIACFIVLVAKGPAYVADAYPLPDDDGRREPSG
jgi:hypothetical protein